MLCWLYKLVADSRTVSTSLSFYSRLQLAACSYSYTSCTYVQAHRLANMQGKERRGDFMKFLQTKLCLIAIIISCLGEEGLASTTEEIILYVGWPRRWKENSSSALQKIYQTSHPGGLTLVTGMLAPRRERQPPHSYGSTHINVGHICTKYQCRRRYKQESEG